MKKEVNEIFKSYATLAADALPQIPCIDPYSLAKNLGKGQQLVNYTNHLLVCSQNNFNVIALIILSHSYHIRVIETFDYGQKGNEYVYFMIEA